MKIAILSCNTGGGHNAAAAALAEELSARGHESRTYNTLDFLPKGAADLISRGHDFAYRYAPKLYGAGYRMEEKRPSPLLYENSIRGIGPLYEALVDLGADAAICVHVFPAMMMTELRCGYGLRMPTWFVATDFTCSPGVGELQLDGICLVAGLGGKDQRDGSLAYYFSEPVVCNDAKGVGPLVLAYTEMIARK